MRRLVASVVAQGSSDGHPLEQLAPSLAEEVRQGYRVAEGDERGVDAVLQRDAVTHQVEAEARPLTRFTDRWIGQR